jgi:hypothetical protein
MPRPADDEIITQQNRRLFFQWGGPFPNNPLSFAGVEGQYAVLEGVTRPLRGAIEPIKVYDPRRAKQFKFAGRKATAPDFPTATLRLLERRGALPFALGDMSCAFNLYLSVGKCDDLSDFLHGWEDFVEIVSYAEGTSVDEGARMAWEDDTQAEDAVAITLERKYGIGALSFAAKAAAEISREVVDAVYGSNLQCGDCGPSDDGTRRIYAVAKSSGAGSPGLPAELIYSVTGGTSWVQTTITSFGATEDPLAIDIAGDKLVIIGADAYYWATLNAKTGVPGSFTKVTTGFVASKTPRDLFVLGPQAIFFVGDGGYIYKSTNLAAGVTPIDPGDATTENLLRIHGDGQNTLVAVGAGSTVLKSTDRGVSWAATVAEPSAIQLDVTAVCVRSSEHFLVGTGNSGRVFYTLDGGEIWSAIEFTGTGSGYVRDIVFATDEVGYFVHDDTTPTGTLWSTWNGGADWVRNDGGSRRVLNWPVIDRVNRLAVPAAAAQVDANNLVIAGLAGDGTDGVLLRGSANVL